MSEDATDATVERLPPDEAFGLLGHEIRFSILEVLNDADDELAFSAIRERVGVEDPGQFNYHLGELLGRFVREGEDGYRLAAAGKRVVGAALSGGVTKAMDAETVATDAACMECGESMVARFRADGIAIECPGCGMQYTDPDVPTGIVEGRPPETVATAVELWARRNDLSAGYGFCHYCDGPIDRQLCLPDEGIAPEWFTEDADPDLAATAVHDCKRCGEFWHAAPPIAVLTHPAVIGFHHDHGIDLRETPSWELPWLSADLGTVVAEDPLRLELSIELDDERVTFTFDRELSVVSEKVTTTE
jgi:predicted RNA-binding Zn-ribbon protein involved in translation (DUF1610 family)